VRIAVDLTKCQGYANCVMEAPELFDLDDETSKATVLVDDVPKRSADEARQAVASCPVHAITLGE